MLPFVRLVGKTSHEWRPKACAKGGLCCQPWQPLGDICPGEAIAGAVVSVDCKTLHSSSGLHLCMKVASLASLQNTMSILHNAFISHIVLWSVITSIVIQTLHAHLIIMHCSCLLLDVFNLIVLHIDLRVFILVGLHPFLYMCREYQNYAVRLDHGSLSIIHTSRWLFTPDETSSFR